MEYALVALVVAGLGFLVWFGIRERKAGGDSVVVDAQKDVIDGQKDVNAARVATADTSTGRADRLRDRFTRR